MSWTQIEACQRNDLKLGGIKSSVLDTPCWSFLADVCGEKSGEKLGGHLWSS